MKKRTRTLALSAALLLALAALLHWPVAAWLEARESWLPADVHLDAVYILAGGSGGERGRGVVDWLVAGGRADRILLPYDDTKGPWSRPDQQNLTMGEWALRGLNAALSEAGLDLPVEVVDLDMRGTDAEVASLAKLVEGRADLARIALATSRFHIRRTAARASEHFGKPPGMIPGSATWKNRSPWVVGIELLKMLRDRMGLGRVVNRGLWMDSEVGGQKSEVGGR
ncbi:MAG: hypothetical protein QGH42_05410 [Kiritimatiellia bacterium]|jgi:hypothetical protein|nr:hypothetical protein [Kiritimatiellia bacterium]MDP6629914.1 hypothetical protein [Kiritimatiellia bacterium]MDP6810112.1 hypothetical protein [Kiritimatiellia bacterium]MDP7023669.1 hypothetical protein [Kiritimatiellia bacterium]